MSIIIERPNGAIQLNMPEPITYIYCFRSPNGKHYVGQTNNLPRRISEHLSGQGSKPLLKDLVEYGRAAFDITILEVLTTNDPLIVAYVEDSHIEKLNCLHPNGYNLRLNRDIMPNGESIDISNIQITGKFVYQDEGKLCFTIGECSQTRSYQTLMNLGQLPELKKKKKFRFSFFEVRVELDDYVFFPCMIYDLTLKHELGKFIIISANQAV